MCARDLYRLHQLCAGTAAEGLASYALLQRLLWEQCEVIADKQRPSTEDDDAGEGGVPVALKAPEHVGSDSLQSPHDAEATYNARKGKGYEVQIAETCVEADDGKTDTVNRITHVAVTAACASDEHATMPVLEALEERGQRPDELVADTAFGTRACSGGFRYKPTISRTLSTKKGSVESLKCLCRWGCKPYVRQMR